MKFRKKPIVIEAVQWLGDNWDEIEMFAPYGILHNAPAYKKQLSIQTLEGTMTAEVGDWIIEGVKGEFYPCKPDIFERTYERVEG